MAKFALAAKHYQSSLRLVKREDYQTKQNQRQPRQTGSIARRWKIALTVTGGAIAFLILVAAMFWPTKKTVTHAPPSKSVALPVAPTVLSQRSSQPQTLKELLALPADQLETVDVAVMNLLCAEGLRGAENLDVQSALDTLDAWARHVSSETLRNFHRFAANPKEYGHSLAHYRMMMLVTVLQQDFGTIYNPERALPQLRGEREPSDVFFADSKDVFLHGLLSGKHVGTCSSLPVLFVAVAQRLGYPVTLAAATGHFYVRYEDGGEHLNIEATSVGFSTYPDEHYRRWPFPLSDEEVRTYGLLRPMNKRQMLGSFLTIRANTLTSMKRFDEAAAAWAQAARLLPETPALNRIVERTRQRAKHERDADRWDELWDEVARLPISTSRASASLRDRRLQVQQFMSQSTNLVSIETAVAELKEEVEAYRRQAALASDSPAVEGEIPSPAPPVPTELLALLSDMPQPVRVRIPAERVPPEYLYEIPAELQKRLAGMTKEQEIVTAMWEFHVEEVNRINQQAMAALMPKPAQPLPRNVRAEWLPEEYRQAMPEELRRRLETLNRPELVQSEIRRFQLEEENNKRSEAMKALLTQPFEPGHPNEPLTKPPVHIEIVPAKLEQP